MNNNSRFKIINGRLHELIFRTFVVKGGVRIYPKKGRVFPLWVPVE